MVGEIGGCLALEPIRAGGDSVIRSQEFISETTSTPDPENPTETMSETVTVMVT